MRDSTLILAAAREERRRMNAEVPEWIDQLGNVGDETKAALKLQARLLRARKVVKLLEREAAEAESHVPPSEQETYKGGINFLEVSL
jgi:hypothetical protein